MRFGFFGRGQIAKTITSPGTGSNPVRYNFYTASTPFASSISARNIPYVFAYDPANGGSTPNNQSLISSSIVAFNQSDQRALSRVDLIYESAWPLNDPILSTRQPNGFVGFEYTTGSPTNKTFFLRLYQSYRWFSVLSGSGSTPEVTHQILNLYGLKQYLISEGTGGPMTTLTGNFPVTLTHLTIRGQSGNLTSVPQEFPANLIYLNYNNNAYIHTVAEINAKISRCSKIKYLYFTALNLTTPINVNNATRIGAGTLDISHMPDLLAISLTNNGSTTSSLTDINHSITNGFEVLMFAGLGNVSRSTINNLFFQQMNRSDSRYVHITSCALSLYFNITDTHIKSSLGLFSIANNNISGNVSITTSKPNLSDSFFLGGETGVLDDGTGNPGSTSINAGASNQENGGAGGTGGNNASGNNGNNYGGGGGGAAAGGTRTGGNGANGLIRIRYYTGGIHTEQVFTTSGSFVTPNDVTKLYVECWGAGGGGSGNPASNPGGGGGGGGAFASKEITVLSNTSYNYTVGIGGTGGSSLNNGNNGGDTYWDAGLDVKAEGGKAGLVSGTGGSGGLVANSVGDIRFSGGNGGTTTTAAAGAGGGGGAGSSGLTRNKFHTVDISGLTNARFIALSNCNIHRLTLPTGNTNIDELYLGGNYLDVTVDTNLVSQIQSMTGLIVLRLSTGTVQFSTELRQGQSSVNGFGNNLDLSALTVLTQFFAAACKLTGSLTLPSSLTTLHIQFNNVSSIAGTGTFASIRAFYVEENPLFVFDFTRLTGVSEIQASNTAITTMDLSNRTNTNAWDFTTIEATDCLSLTSVTFPTASNRMTITTSSGSTGRIFFQRSSLLSSMSNMENITYSNLTLLGQRRFNVSSCALNQDLKFGINNFLPTDIVFNDNSMSVANVDLNLWNIINNRTKWNTTAVTKSINAAGTNGTPTGTYAAPTGYRTHAALTITAVTKANPGVVTVSNIGTVANGDVVYIYDCAGMTQLNGNYYKVNNVSGNTFELQTPGGVNVDTSGYGTYTGSAGRARPDGDLSGGTDTKAGVYVLVTQYGWTVTMN